MLCGGGQFSLTCGIEKWDDMRWQGSFCYPKRSSMHAHLPPDAKRLIQLGPTPLDDSSGQSDAR